jgi:hypothetical protein
MPWCHAEPPLANGPRAAQPGQPWQPPAGRWRHAMSQDAMTGALGRAAHGVRPSGVTIGTITHSML